ncbi:hypothetical protein [Microcoleus sp. FACHB-68]|uniref:hypothetical protein n=1 Tax=Microcoleus sp. FACHB-68 TaxID=2692826 RepID=UPI001683D336|nr:hypothetical protein [Microcoleus sp. FACHB-68]MBD1936458.1 hypothetical protein [Microcoleus sp. FACHB-68]
MAVSVHSTDIAEQNELPQQKVFLQEAAALWLSGSADGGYLMMHRHKYVGIFSLNTKLRRLIRFCQVNKGLNANLYVMISFLI